MASKDVSEQQLSTNTGRELSFVQIVQIIWRQRRLVVLCAVPGLVIAVVIAFILTPTYKVEAVLMPVVDPDAAGLASLTGQLGGLASSAGINTRGRGGPRDEAIALLSARAVTSELIDQEHILPALFAKRWDKTAKRWAVAPQDIPTVWMGVKKFEDIRTVVPDPASGLVNVSVTWSDPDLAARWITKLTQLVNRRMRQNAIDEAQASISFLSDELKKTEVLEIRQSIYALIESQTKALTMANVRQEFAFKAVDPPAVPDRDDVTSPNKWLLTVLGLLIGGMLGVLVALGRRSGVAVG